MTATMPVGDLTGWRQILTCDFDTDMPEGTFPGPYADQLGAYPTPWKDTSGFGTYTPAIVSVTGGVLRQRIHTSDGRARVSALTPRLPTMLYGRFAVRLRFDRLPGYKIAWLLWPNSNNGRADGEIDFPEMSLDSATVWAFMHRTASAGADDQAWFKTVLEPGTWHTCVIEWSPGLVVFNIDGREVGRTSVRTPFTPMHWVLQTETALGLQAPPDPTVTGTVDVDWIAVWAWDPNAKGPPDPREIILRAPPAATGKVLLETVAAAPTIKQVKWVVGDVEVASSNTPPWSKTVDTTKVANGTHPVFTKALDEHGWFNGTPQTMAVHNPLILVAPRTARGIVGLSIVPWRWFKMVKWVVDDREIGSKKNAPWLLQWDSTRFANGDHRIYCKALSEFGWADGPTQTITIAN